MLSVLPDPSIPLVAATSMLVEPHGVGAAPMPDVERALQRLARAHATTRRAQPLNILRGFALTRVHQPVDVLEDAARAI